MHLQTICLQFPKSEMKFFTLTELCKMTKKNNTETFLNEDLTHSERIFPTPFDFYSYILKTASE